MKNVSLKEAFGYAVRASIIAGAATLGYGFYTKDYSQVMPSILFSYVTAMGVSGHYQRQRRDLLL